jgi:hypothetical protein
MRSLIHVLVLVVSLTLSLSWSWPAEAQERRAAGSQTVREWRHMASKIGVQPEAAEVFSIGYALGAMSWMSWQNNIFLLGCSPGRIAVGELIAFLQYSAEPEWTMRDALLKMMVQRGGCEVVTPGPTPARP